MCIEFGNLDLIATLYLDNKTKVEIYDFHFASFLDGIYFAEFYI